MRYLSLARNGGMDGVSKGNLKTAISTLTNIETLHLGAWEEVSEILMSPGDTSNRLSKLKHLEIKEGEYSNVRHDDKFGNLALYPALVSLDIHLLHEISPESLSWGQPLPKIEVLRLNLRHDSKANAEFVLNRFPNIQNLTLDSRQFGVFDIEPLLRTLSTSPPNLLTSLTLLSPTRYLNLSESRIPRPCDKFFPSFSHLTYLYLAQFSFTPEICTSLSKLPQLETLGFGPGAILEEKRIEALVIGSSRVESLKKLILDQVVQGKIGWSAKEDRVLHDDHTKSRYHLAPDWEKPRFDPENDGTFTLDRVEEMVERIEETGIKVEGTVIQAITSGREWQEEVTLCAELWEKTEQFKLEMELEDQIAFALELERDPGFKSFLEEMRAEVGEDIWDGNVSDYDDSCYM